MEYSSALLLSSNTDFFMTNATDYSTAPVRDTGLLIMPNSTNMTNTTTRPNMPSSNNIDAQALLEAILMTYPEYRVAKAINSYGYITEVVVGSVANILALIVMLGLTHLPICNYMAALALADLSVVLGPCLIRWLLTKNVDPRTSSTAVCRFLNFQTYWSFDLSAWLLVAMTIDRFIAITFPLKAIKLSTPRRARIIIVLIMIAVAIINLPFLTILTVETQVGVKQDVCVPYDEFIGFIEDVWPWIDAALYSFLPFLLLLIFNFLIIMSHRRSLRMKMSLKGSKTGQIPLSTLRVGRKLTITLLIVAFTFIIMTAPRVILMIIRPTVFNFKPTPTSVDFEILAKYTLTGSVVNILMFGNHSINFFLYVLSGRKFRRQLIIMIKALVSRRNRHIQVAPVDFSSTDTQTASIRRKKSLSREDSGSTASKSQTNGIAFPPRSDLPTIHESKSEGLQETRLQQGDESN